MRLIDIYKCLCDLTRLRIVHLLSRGPLCVCHFQSVLDAPQVKVSKHLAYLRQYPVLEAIATGSELIFKLGEKHTACLATECCGVSREDGATGDCW